MRKMLLIGLACCLSLAACKNPKKPSKSNFTKAINSYLDKQGNLCASVGAFPIDLTVAEQKMTIGEAPEMIALEQAGLVHSRDTIVAPRHTMFGPVPPHPVKRYELTDTGKPYYKSSNDAFSPAGELCYAQTTVDSIVKWTQPVTEDSQSQTEVTYTYKIENLAAWAQNPAVQRAFPFISTTLNAQSKDERRIGLHLTNQGWKVPGF